MAEYIERSAAIKAAKHAWAKGLEPSQYIEALPAADVAPVVRCKGCKDSYKDGTGRTCEGYWYELSEFAVSVKDDDFCSYGERKPSADG